MIRAYGYDWFSITFKGVLHVERIRAHPGDPLTTGCGRKTNLDPRKIVPGDRLCSLYCNAIWGRSHRIEKNNPLDQGERKNFD